jgi:hypothetical protein
MKSVLAALVFCVLLGSCSDAEDGGPGGEPFAFDDWVAGIEYVLIVELAGEPRSAESRDFVVWSGAVSAIEWQAATTSEGGSSVAVTPPASGSQIALTLADTITVPTGERIIVLVNDLRVANGVQRVVNVAMDSDWQTLPGSLEPAVAGLEAAAAATAVSDRRGAILAVLQDMTR